uniref:Pentacotripeptide-repeat region of PRORP domain-containing protein n=1 Tax=Setaria italica TaxID=4555 RepID=K3YDB6_SETIT
MRLLAAAARQPKTPHPLLVALHRLLSTATTTSSYDPTAQFLHPDHRRVLSLPASWRSLPASLRHDALLALARLLKTVPQCHLALHAVSPPRSSGTPSSTPLAARFAAASRLAVSASALRPFAAILLAALLPAVSPDLLSWSSSYGSTGGSARVRYAALRLALHAFLAAGMAAEALHVLARVRRSGNTPSLSALAALLRLLFRSGEVRAAWNVFEEMATRGPRPSLAIFNAMVLGFCHRGMLRVASGLLGVLEKKFSIVPDVCSYNILIKGHCLFGWSGDAFKLFEEMRRAGCEPTVVTYNILVDVLCHEGRMVEARSLFDEMAQVGIKANTITFNVLIDGYAKTGLMDEASAAYKEMKVRGLVPDSCTFNILAAGSYKFGHAAQLCWDGRLDGAWELLRGAIEQDKGSDPAGTNMIEILDAG